MIKQKNVLILGAGASYDFGYPLGKDLKKLVASTLSGGRFQKLLEKGYGFRPAIKFSIEGFIHDLKKDEAATIDRFLAKSSAEYQMLGKVAIAQTIMRCEDEEQLFSQKRNWYEQLYSIINTRPALNKLGDHELSVITFNYDRSLEHFLYRKTLGEYGSVKSDEIAVQLKKIPVIHIHGKINPLPWESNINAREYGKDGFIPDIFKLAEDLRLPGQNALELERVKSVIEDAQRIYFVGFGYDSENLAQLDIELLGMCGSIWGTCCDIPIARQEMIRDLFPQKQIQFYPSSVDAYDFIMSHFTPNAK